MGKEEAYDRHICGTHRENQNGFPILSLIHGKKSYYHIMLSFFWSSGEYIYIYIYIYEKKNVANLHREWLWCHLSGLVVFFLKGGDTKKAQK